MTARVADVEKMADNLSERTDAEVLSMLLGMFKWLENSISGDKQVERLLDGTTKTALILAGRLRPGIVEDAFAIYFEHSEG